MDIEENLIDCPLAYTMQAIGGKWKMLILYQIYKNAITRYGELKRAIPTISHKMLSSQLKELIEYGLVERMEYPQIPPKVEYILTGKGKTLIPLLKELYTWGRENKEKG